MNQFAIVLCLLFLSACSKNNSAVTINSAIKTGKCYDKAPDSSLCAAYWERWFYDEAVKNCIKKEYSGCNELGCKTQEDCKLCAGLLTDTSQSNSFLILKLDYKTNQFEGGKELMLKGPKDLGSDLLVESQFRQPMDDGDIKFMYSPTQTNLFEASIIWMGSGQIYNPTALINPSTFQLLTSPLSLPNKLIKELSPNYIADRDFMKVWQSINKLDIVKDYINSPKNIGLSVYTPSVGRTDTSRAKWIVIMQKIN